MKAQAIFKLLNCEISAKSTAEKKCHVIRNLPEENITVDPLAHPG